MRVSPEIANLVPYQPGKPIAETQRQYGLKEVIKLASNENPLGPSPKVMAALSAAISDIHRYPDASCFDLTQKLAEHYGVKDTWIVCGNGSNEIVDLLVRIFCESR